MNDQLQKVIDAFKAFTIWDGLEILLLTVVIFLLLRYLKVRRNAVALPYWLAGIFIAFGALFIFQGEFRVLWKLALYLGGASLIFLIIIFAPQLHRMMIRMAQGRWGRVFYTAKYDLSPDELRNTIAEIIRAAQNMSKKNTGALIVIAPGHIQTQILESGTELGALVSASLLESVFNTKSPMHDGAVIIRGNRILAAGCFLPLSQNTELPGDLGTRHRAALGVSEANDVLAIIVSEQTGIISVCREGTLTRYYNSDMLEETLERMYGLQLASPVRKRKKGK